MTAGRSASGFLVVSVRGGSLNNNWALLSPKGQQMLGLKIVPHPLARDRRTEFLVTRWMTRDKKRKNWRVMRVEIDRPGCWQIGDTLYMHPDLVAKLTHAA